MNATALPLAGLRVLDFSTLLPGPLAGLLLAEAGAEVTKIERAGEGDEMRGYVPRIADTSANFCLLNRGKKSVQLDLKTAEGLRQLEPLLASADVLIEQFRPGVMARLGLGYEQLRARHPRLIYCSITGFGQDGPRAQLAGHDLNYMAISGLLGLTAGADGAPVLPHAPIADIAGGSYPAVINVLLALLARERSGHGCHIDIAMTENLFTLAYWGVAQGHAEGRWPQAGSGLVTGGSPRYQIYACADRCYLAAAPIEERFWTRFCDLIGLAADLRGPQADPQLVTAAVTEIIASRPGAHWQRLFEAEDVCCCLVNSLEDAVHDAHFLARGVFALMARSGGAAIPALPVPVAACLRSPEILRDAPALGAHNPVAALGGQAIPRGP